MLKRKENNKHQFTKQCTLNLSHNNLLKREQNPYMIRCSCSINGTQNHVQGQKILNNKLYLDCKVSETNNGGRDCGLDNKVYVCQLNYDGARKNFKDINSSLPLLKT